MPASWLNKTGTTLKLSLACATAIVCVASPAHADELSDTKAQADALAQQNRALQQRINEIGMQQDRQGFSNVSATPATAAPPPRPGFPRDPVQRRRRHPPSSGGQTASGSAPTARESLAASSATPIQAIGGTPPVPAANALTYMDITLNGTVDLGVTYQTHGTPLNGVYAPSLE